MHWELKTLTIQANAVFQVVDFRLARNLLAIDRYRSMVVDLLDPEEPLCTGTATKLFDGSIDLVATTTARTRLPPPFVQIDKHVHLLH